MRRERDGGIKSEKTKKRKKEKEGGGPFFYVLYLFLYTSKFEISFIRVVDI